MPAPTLLSALRRSAPVHALSDVHGHPEALRASLREAGLIDVTDRWTGGQARLHVLGDLVDRGPDGLGVIRLLRSLQQQAGERVRVLLGNHEVLALAMWMFPEEGFLPAWRRNGGNAADQAGLTPDDVAWLRDLPVLALDGDTLLAHSDSTAYLDWGRSIDEVNARVRELLSRADPAGVQEVWRGLTQRRRFTGPQGPARVRQLLTTYGGSRLVHGHSIVSSLPGGDGQGRSPLAYAEGLALAIDGGHHAGGPLLRVRLDQAWS